MQEDRVSVSRAMPVAAEIIESMKIWDLSSSLHVFSVEGEFSRSSFFSRRYCKLQVFSPSQRRFAN